MVTSPLGQYGPLIAAVTAVGVIGAFILSVFVQGVLGMPDTSVQSLRELALLALGAVFGSAATISASHAEISTANKRLDAIGAPSASAVVNGNGSGNGSGSDH